MSTPLRQAVTPKAPPKPSSLFVATPVNDSSAAIKFWASQSVSTFSGERFRVQLYSFEDYCDAFNLPDSDRLREWKTKARKRFIGYKPDPYHILNQVKISQFTSLQPFIAKFQEYTNKVLTQQTKGSSGIKQKIISDNFHSLVGIPTFKNALTPAYAGLIHKASPATLEEAYNIVCENYAISVECELNEDVKATSKWNPFSSSSRKKEPSIAETCEAKFKDIQSQFEAIYLTHERPSHGPRPMQGPYVFTSNFYNCNDQGQKSKRCTKPCSICKSTDHTNFGCNQRMCNTTQCPIAVMMADQYYQNEKHPLTTPKNSCTTPKLPTQPPTSCNSRWNPEHPNLFAALEEQLDFNNPALAEDKPRYNIVTVETAPESPANQNNTANSIELDLKIHNEFPTSNNEPMEATSFESNAMDDIPQVNNVYTGETTDRYTSTPMEISPLVEEEPMANPPIKTSPLIYSDSTSNNPMETTLVEASDTILNSTMYTFNTPAEMGLVDNNKSHLPNGGQPSTMNGNSKRAIPSIQRYPPDASNLKAEKLVKEILVDKLFAETAVTISLADLL
ncbi:hypothetical protein DSO57_1001815 [Entomophthora muscae]|uniref:Uncharacterized protein n=1 Tax=Entomophthora muscae TaxID=34485 RepID=A0ACC2U6U1_9FUNG|nr:hypothetical protein DSO57_1001815 [Entomophthora muscae]